MLIITLSSFLFLAPLLPCSHAATSTVIVTVPAPSPTNSPSYTSASEFQSDILAAHNFYRSEHNATSLSWNTSLATYGTKWANGCNFKHSGGPSGENLAAGYPNATTAVDAWGNERNDYNFVEQGFSEQTGHFTQVVWKASRSVGCGRVDCAGTGEVPGWYVVCEYYPPGNVIGEFEQNVQKQIKGASKYIQGGKNGAGSLRMEISLQQGLFIFVLGMSLGYL
ncbi:MAG: hypothetical protein M1827_003042 [Pycnora praestabilis]|nr:MAG: hypothetical protein M1827_003042 [Pycnora praestabilis]